MAHELKCFIDGFHFLEGLRWHENRLWMSDFYGRKVIAADRQGNTEIITEVAGQPSGLGWLPDGRLLVVSMIDRSILRLEKNGELSLHADLTAFSTGPCNDMTVDRYGRAYVGNFGFDLMSGADLAPAGLVMVDPEGEIKQVAADLYFPNGSVISSDGKRLLVNETFGNRVSAFDIMPDGTLGIRRDWAVFGALPEGKSMAEVIPQLVVAPDGAALDKEGCLWIADAIGNRAIRVREGGEILEEVRTGTDQAFACAMGGECGSVIYVCVAPDSIPVNRESARESAVKFLKVGMI